MEETDFYSIFKKICGKKDIKSSNEDSWTQMLNIINGNKVEQIEPELTEQTETKTEPEQTEPEQPEPELTETKQIETEQTQLGGANKPTNLKLYDQVRKLANKKFSSPSGVYRSSWMVREYKKRGGKYSGTKPKSSGIKRWFKEDWIDLKRPIKNSKGKVIGYKKCGRKSSLIKGKYPLCRPSKSINKKSPRTYQSISKKSIEKAKRDKKGSKSIKFGGSGETIYSCPICNEIIKDDIDEHFNKHNEDNRIRINYEKIKQMGGYHSNLRENLIKNLKEKYTCPICKKIIKGNVQNHINRHKTLDIKVIIDKPLPNLPGLITKKRKSKPFIPERSQSIVFDEKISFIPEISQSVIRQPFIPERSQSIPSVIFKPFIPERNQSLQKIDSDKESIYSDWGLDKDENEDGKQEGGRSQFYGKKSKIMIKVPESVRKAALYAFNLKKLGFKGGLETGWKRAKQLSTSSEIPIEDLKYIRAFFARHIYTSYPTYSKWAKSGRSKDKYWHNKRGIIAILIWGGIPGIKWVNSKSNIRLLNKHYNKDYKPFHI